MRASWILGLLSLLLIACAEDAPTVVNSGAELFADQQYYPILEGTTWTYRLDSAGVSGVATITARMAGSRQTDSLLYAVQANEILRGGRTETDTQYVRKNDVGVFLSSPGLLNLGGIPTIPGFPAIEIPKEYLAMPFNPGFQATWDIITIEFNQIPLFPIYFRVKGRYLGTGDVQTQRGTLKQCAHTVITIEARFPNPEDPTNILNPLLINEKADFWFTRPYGLALIDGSEAVFILLRGGLPLQRNFAKMRQELTDMYIVQPSPVCSW